VGMTDTPIFFTVLTPTYNRAGTLHRVYESLSRQTFRGFEWVVVDDGSTDNTHESILDWQARADFPIRYFWQNNQHKKTAFNRGVREARGKLIVGLDSDDEMPPDALAIFKEAWESIPPARRESYVAVTGLCARPDGSIVGDRYPQDVFDSTAVDVYFRYRVKGEKFGCMRTDILRTYPFPEDVAGFVPESLVWWAIARAARLKLLRLATSTNKAMSLSWTVEASIGIPDLAARVYATRVRRPKPAPPAQAGGVSGSVRFDCKFECPGIGSRRHIPYTSGEYIKTKTAAVA
jgi:glycosyltransferase involved in cell wall biosynthesis